MKWITKLTALSAFIILNVMGECFGGKVRVYPPHARAAWIQNDGD